MASEGDARSGTFANGMDFRPGAGAQDTPLHARRVRERHPREGCSSRMSRRWFDPFVEAGYAIWHVTRRRNMPAGHSIEDMADDYAQADL